MSNTNNDSLFYNSRVEVCMALCDVTSSFYIGSKGNFTASRPLLGQFIKGFWKEPGALQWVEKMQTETLDGKLTLQFARKLVIDYEELDVTSYQVRFEVFHDNLFGYNAIYGEKHRWSWIELSLDKLLYVGSKGLLIPLRLKLDNLPHYLEQTANECVPGSIFLRAELIQPPNYSALLQFSMRVTPYNPSNKYFLEFYRMNSEGWLEVVHPYILIDRRFNPFEEFGVVYLESAISNGDLDRILKVEVFKKSSSKKKGFTLFTAKSLLELAQPAPIKVELESPHLKSKKKYELTIKCQNVPIASLPQFLNKGLKINSLYAVDYSESNANEVLHDKNLHDVANKSTFEETLSILHGVSAEFCNGDVLFYPFGNNSINSHISVLPSENKLKCLLKSYRESVEETLKSRLENLELGGDKDETRQIKCQRSIEELSTSSSSHCIPQMPRKFKQAALGPLLDDLWDFLLSRESNFEYYVVYILTDGQFDEPDTSLITKLMEFRMKPVSIVFIGLGMGDLESLNQIVLTVRSKSPHGREFLRLLHFRSLEDWRAALSYYKFKSEPIDILKKEIFSQLKDQALNYLRIKYPTINR